MENVLNILANFTVLLQESLHSLLHSFKDLRIVKSEVNCEVVKCEVVKL